MYYLLDKYKRSLTLFLNVQMFNTWRTDNTTAFNSTMYRSCYKTIPFFATRNRLDHVFDPMCTSGIIVDACSLNLTFHLCLVSVNSTVPIDVGNGQLAIVVSQHQLRAEMTPKKIYVTSSNATTPSRLFKSVGDSPHPCYAL